MLVTGFSNMNKKHKSTSPSAIQVNTQCKTVCIDDKLDVISQLEKGEQIVDICCNVRLPHSSICTIHDKAERIAESAKSGTKAFLCATRLPQSYWNKPYQKLWMWVSYIFIACLLTQWSGVLLEKLNGSRLVKKFPAFYGTRRFITAFTCDFYCIRNK